MCIYRQFTWGLYAWWANKVKGGYRFAKDYISPAVLIHARVTHSFRHSYWFVFIFRPRKSLVLATKQRAWRQQLKTDWKPRDSSLSQFPSQAQSSLRLFVASEPMTPSIRYIPVSCSPSVSIMMFIDAWIQITLNNLWYSMVHGRRQPCKCSFSAQYSSHCGNGSISAAIFIPRL